MSLLSPCRGAEPDGSSCHVKPRRARKHQLSGAVSHELRDAVAAGGSVDGAPGAATLPPRASIGATDWPSAAPTFTVPTSFAPSTTSRSTSVSLEASSAAVRVRTTGAAGDAGSLLYEYEQIGLLFVRIIVTQRFLVLRRLATRETRGTHSR